jgi:hypothetical protein
MSLDVTLKKMMPTEVYSRNITHNLGKMAAQVQLSSGDTLYEILWRPEHCDPPYIIAEELIPHLGEAIIELINNPEKYKKFNPENGWGSYEGLIEFVSAYHHACVSNPDATIEVCR